MKTVMFTNSTLYIGQSESISNFDIGSTNLKKYCYNTTIVVHFSYYTIAHWAFLEYIGYIIKYIMDLDRPFSF